MSEHVTVGKPVRPSAAVRAGRFIYRNVLYVYLLFAILYLMLPVAVMALSASTLRVPLSITLSPALDS